MSLDELQRLESQHVIGTYARLPVEFIRGEGSWLWDAEGNEYLDLLCGISVTNLGHCHPRVVEAIREQAVTLIHVSNLFYTEPAMRLAERLTESSLGGKVFFCNSGAEAIEAAVKLSRRAKAGGGVVTLAGGFHGRTYAALSATGQEEKQAPFAPLVPGFTTVAPTAEAVMGAVFLDGGFEQAAGVIRRLFRDDFGEIDELPNLVNPKGELQELLQAKSPIPPRYEQIAVSGPDHSRQFECAAYHGDVELGRGLGRSKKLAESAAALAALERLRRADASGGRTAEPAGQP